MNNFNLSGTSQFRDLSDYRFRIDPQDSTFGSLISSTTGINTRAISVFHLY